MTDSLKVDIIIKSFSRDYKNLEILLSSISLFISDYHKLWIFIDEEETASDFIAKIRPDLPARSDIIICPKSTITGYLNQQLYKLNYGNYTGADFIIPLDSDMVLFKPGSIENWLVNKKAFIPFCNWTDAISYPPLSLHSQLIAKGLAVAHNIGMMIDMIREIGASLGCNNISYDGELLAFYYSGSVYELRRTSPHSVWLSSLRQLTCHPVDTMRCHYAFSRKGLQKVITSLETLFNADLREIIADPAKFPVFSEYQVYGNLVRPEAEMLDHVMLDQSSGSKVENLLPIVKCNSRQESSFEVYRRILDAEFAHIDSRLEVLSAIRSDRNNMFPQEDWN